MSFLHTFRHEHSRVCVMTARRLLFITSVIGSVVEYNVANVVARVRFPDDAFFLTRPTCKSPMKSFISAFRLAQRGGAAEAR